MALPSEYWSRAHRRPLVQDHLSPGSKEKLAGLPLGSGGKLSLAFLLGDLTGLLQLFGAKAALVTPLSVTGAGFVLQWQGSVAGTEIISWLPTPKTLTETAGPWSRS